MKKEHLQQPKIAPANQNRLVLNKVVLNSDERWCIRFASTDFDWKKFQKAALNYLVDVWDVSSGKPATAYIVRSKWSDSFSDYDFVEFQHTGHGPLISELKRKFYLYFPFSNVGCCEVNQCADGKLFDADDVKSRDPGFFLGECESLLIEAAFRDGVFEFVAGKLRQERNACFGEESHYPIQDKKLAKRMLAWVATFRNESKQ